MNQLDLDRNFPMPDEASARLMMVKAECLRAARVISEAERLTILARALERLMLAIHQKRGAQILARLDLDRSRHPVRGKGLTKNEMAGLFVDARKNSAGAAQS